MYLSDTSIYARHARKPLIVPFNPMHVQPAGYDLTLADFVTIAPGQFRLACTREWIEMPDDLAAQLTGRSSIGRLGVIVHATAGHVDPGFRGQLTLEMFNLSKQLRTFLAGARIAQLLFVPLDFPAAIPYDGRYQDQHGATESRWEGLISSGTKVTDGAAPDGHNPAQGSVLE